MSDASGDKAEGSRAGRRAGLFLVGVVILVGALVAIVALASAASSSDVPAAPPRFAAPVAPGGVSALDVQSRDGSRVTAVQPSRPRTPAGPPSTVAIASDAMIEVLDPASPTDIKVGDVLAIDGVPNQVKNFAIRWVIIMPPGTTEKDGIARSPGGFTGVEADPSLDDRAILSGKVTAVSGGDVTFDGAQGPVTLDFVSQGSSPLHVLRLAAGALTDVAAGARIAGAFGTKPATGVLVFPASSR